MADVKFGAGLYSNLSYADEADITISSTDTVAEQETKFEASSVTYNTTGVDKIRDFPTFGTPANIVNVPQYGSNQSSQVTAQADAPTLEFTMNYTGADHKSLQDLVTAGANHWFKLSVKNVEAAAGDTTSMYVKGKFAAVNVTPALDGSNSMTVTLSTEGSYYGPFHNA